MPSTLTGDTNSMNQSREQIVPVSGVSVWETCIPDYTTLPPGLATADANPITNVATSILDVRRVFNCKQMGTHVAFRIAYPTGTVTVTTNAALAVFGRTGTSDGWQRLKSISGNTQLLIALDLTNDITDGTSKRSYVDPVDHVFDRMGCNEFVVCVETALNLDGTLERSAYLEHKIF